MSLIYSSFSNDLQDNLQGLLGEYTDLLSYFNTREVKHLVDFQSSYGKSVDQITSDLVKYSKDLRLFHFSGHSDQNGLNFSSIDFSKDHFVHFFNTLNSRDSNIDCVFLNGCSNAAIVERLNNIPVVIGTRSPIDNQQAIKFTADFFKALISGRKSYQEAFDLACSALGKPHGPSINRQKRGLQLLDDPNPVNDYFLVSYDEKKAEQSFPVKKKPLSPVFLATLTLILLTLAGSFIFRDQILKLIKGYECPNWEFPDKCNVLITDFEKSDVDAYIADGINGNQALNSFMEARSREASSQLIVNDKISIEELINRCKFDRVLTGDEEKVNNNYLIGIEIYPKLSEAHRYKTYTIGSLIGLKQELLQIKDAFQGDFLISNLCISCAGKRTELIPVVDAKIEPYKEKQETVPAYQYLQSEMAFMHLNRKDTANAIASLTKIVKAGNNDAVMAAMEEKSNLLLQMRAYDEAYQIQTNYIHAVEDRLSQPGKFEMKEPRKNYEDALLAYKYKRAETVLRNTNASREANVQVLEDLNDLKRIGYQNIPYQGKIMVIESRLKAPRMPEMSIQVTNHERKPVPYATIYFADASYRTDEAGKASIPCKSEFVGQEIRIEAPGYLVGFSKVPNDFQSKPLEIRLEPGESGGVIHVDPGPPARPEPPASSPTLRGIVRNENNIPLFGVRVSLDGKSTKTNSSGKFELQLGDGQDVAKGVVYFRKDGFMDSRVALPANNNALEITMKKEGPAATIFTYTLSGSVTDCDFNNTVLKEIFIDGESVPVFKNRYQHDLRKPQNAEVIFSLPKGFVFTNQGAETLRTGSSSKINHPLRIGDSKAAKYQVTGRVVVQSDRGSQPVAGVEITANLDKTSAKTDKEGRFALTVSGYLCQKLMITNKVVIGEPEGYPLRNYQPGSRNTISMGDLVTKYMLY